jgi:nucleotide-binding universal stress UspA family protein
MLEIQRIVVPIDFSQAASDAQRRARKIADLFDAELHILHVTRSKELSGLPGRLLEADEEASGALFEHVSGWLGLEEGESAPDLEPEDETPSRVCRVIRHERSPHKGILAYTDEIEADLIIIGTHGEGGARGPLLGSVADRVVRMATCPVVTVRPDLATGDPPPDALDEPDARRLVVVPVDFSEPTDMLIAHAKHWAAAFGARVDVLHVIEEPSFPQFYQMDGFRADMPRLASEARDRMGRLVAETDGPAVDVETRVLIGTPAEEIVDYAQAQEARFILMATHGLSGLREYVLGGVTDQVIRSSPCPVGALKSSARSLIRDESQAEDAPGDTDDETA